MYLGMVTMLGGVAVFFGILPFYAVTIVYFILIDRWSDVGYSPIGRTGRPLFS
jgi:hypothetical protein